MSVKRSKGRITVDLSDGVGDDEKQAITDIFVAQKVKHQIMPLARRDQRRQQGTKKQRGSRMPELDKWIAAALERYPDATWKELWQRLATENAYHHDDVWIEGNDVKEWDGMKERCCGERSFRERITAAKRQK